MSTSKPKAGSAERQKVKPNIYRRRTAAGRWTYEIVYMASDGRQRRQTVPGGLKAAETALAKVKLKMGSGGVVAPQSGLTFAKASEDWLAEVTGTLQPKSIRAYTYGLTMHLLPHFGRMRLDHITVQAVAAFVKRMGEADYRREVQIRNGQKPTATTGYSVETIKSVLIPLSCTVAHAKWALGFAGENPVHALDRSRRPGANAHRNAVQRRNLGRDEVDLVIANAVSPYREIIATAVALGSRLGETLGLAWRHVDFDTGFIQIEQQANDRREIARLKTDSAYRRIEAPDWLLSMLREIKIGSSFSGDDDLVFCTRTGKPHGHGNVLARGLYKALDRAEVPRASFHSLRRTHASLWLKDGGDVITLSKRLGHANASVTMVSYAKEIEEAMDHSLRKARVNALFGETKMASLLAEPLAETGHESPGQTVKSATGNVVSLPEKSESARRNATA